MRNDLDLLVKRADIFEKVENNILNVQQNLELKF